MRIFASRSSRRDNLTSGGYAAKSGFTLVELLTVVVIIGVLVAIALPAYKKSVQKSNRSAAKSALLDLASREERFYSLNYAYSSLNTDLFGSGTSITLPYNTPSTGAALYQISVNGTTATTSASGVVTPATFTLWATPVGAQVGDSCGTFILTNTGAQSVSGTNSGCW